MTGALIDGAGGILSQCRLQGDGKDRRTVQRGGVSDYLDVA